MVERIRKTPIKKLLSTVKSELPPSSAPNASGDEDVALRAHDIYESRGRLDGFDVADWLQAEAELRQTERIVNLETLFTDPRTIDITWVERCGNCGQRFAITGDTGPESKFEDIRCPSCHAFWGRSPSQNGFQTTAVNDGTNPS